MTEQNISTSPEPISLKITEKIIEQMKNNSICKIINHFSYKILSRLIFDISSIFFPSSFYTSSTSFSTKSIISSLFFFIISL